MKPGRKRRKKMFASFDMIIISRALIECQRRGTQLQAASYRLQASGCRAQAAGLKL